MTCTAPLYSESGIRDATLAWHPKKSCAEITVELNTVPLLVIYLGRRGETFQKVQQNSNRKVSLW